VDFVVSVRDLHPSREMGSAISRDALENSLCIFRRRNEMNGTRLEGNERMAFLVFGVESCLS
jgi:hypothetical protein